MQFYRIVSACAIVALLGAGPGGKPTQTTAKATLGSTSMTFSATATVVSRDSNGIPTYKVRGDLAINNAGQKTYRANPWNVVFHSVLENGTIKEIMGVGFTKPYLARLSGQTQADFVATGYTCGANCSDTSIILAWNAKKRSYLPVSYAITQDWDPISAGHVVHLDAKHDAIASHVSGPFDDCHACQPGRVPVLLAVRPNASGALVITDIAKTQPAMLKADAAAAWTAALHPAKGAYPTEKLIDIYRYLADRCRLNACAAAWHAVQTTFKAANTNDAFEQMTSALAKQGFTAPAVSR